MFPLSQIELTANGNVRPNRFITGVAGAGNFLLAVEATASTQMILGVSESGTRGPGGVDDTYIAIAGEHLPYRGPLQVGELILGGAVTSILVPLTSDGAGAGIAQAPADGTTCWYGAIALRTGTTNDIIPVWVMPPTPTV